MKVTQVLYSGLGGHGSVVSSLVLADKERKWQHQLIFYGIEELLPAYSSFCETERIPFFYVRKMRGIFRLPGKAVYKAFKKQAPDRVILHSPTLVLPAWCYCLLHRKKLYIVEHTPHATKGLAERLAGIAGLLLARKVVCLSATYQDEWQRRVPWLNIKKRTIVIPNGIDLTRFQQQPKPDSPTYHIGMAGRFSPQKNQALLLEAAIRGFSSGRLGAAVHFHFAGNGETIASLEAQTKSAGLTSQIHFHGLLEEQAMIGFFGSLDLYVHASFAETMCTSAMQALACGLPVAGSDIPGINDLLPEKGIIQLFQNGDAAALLDLILLYQNPDLRAETGAASRMAAVTHFSSSITFEKYSQLIDSN